MKINNIFVNYIQYGNEDGQDIVLLHGWGQNIEMMDPVGRRLQDNFKITIIDLPGFGKSEEPDSSYTIYDYYDVVCKLLDKLKVKKPIMIGHSFGGRIALIYAALRPVTKLILFGSPCRKLDTKTRTKIKVKVLKFMKKVPIINKMADYMKKHIGSRDYRSASPTMRQVLVNVINEDLASFLLKIEAPTILIWGSHDSEVPLEEAKYIESVINNCGLIVYDDCTHYAYLERIDQTINIIKHFIKDVK